MKEKLWTVLAIVIIISLGLAACGPTPTPVPTNTPVPVPPTDTPVPTTPAEEELPTITIGVGGESLTSVDPTSQAGSNVVGIIINVFETLVSFDEDDQIIPWLAKDWEWSEDGTTLTLYLREDVVFSDGTAMTADDVVFSINRHQINNLSVSSQLTESQGYLGVDSSDDYTVNIHFSAPSAQFIGQTLGSGIYVISSEQYAEYGYDNADYPAIPVGTGPYKISDWAEGQYVDLVPNDLYWGDEPNFASARFIPATDESTKIAMLQAGEVDMITQVNGANIPTLEAAGYSRWDVEQAHNIVLIFDLVDETLPWNDIKVRQAIDYVIDQDAVIETIFNGQHKTAVWLKEWELGYQPEFSEATLGYDVAEAQQLMADAGYADGFEMPLTYAAFMEWGTTLTDYLTAQLELINITVVPTGISDFMEFMDAQNNLHDPHTEGGCVFLFDVGWPGNPDPIINLTNGFYGGKSNCLYYRSDLDEIIDEALRTVDDAARADLITQAYEIITADMPVVPLMLEVSTSISVASVVYTKSYGGMGAGPIKLCDLTKD
jgi:peptide/nickel transport system substrate-binding protein